MIGPYFDIFESSEDVLKQFEAPKGALDNSEVLFARYECEGYEGDALVVYRKDGKLWEVNGYHCSCMGLEGQWEPEETSPQALAKRDLFPKGSDAQKAFREMIGALLQPPRVIVRVMDDGLKTKDGCA